MTSAPTSPSPEPDPTAALAGSLADVLGRHWGATTRIDDMRRLSGGASRETWAFRATSVGEQRGSGGSSLDLVLQRERPGGVRHSVGLGREAAVLRAAATAAVPVPELILADGDPGTDGHRFGSPWLITAFVPGETIARRILRDDRYCAARPRLAGQCGTVLASVHRIPMASVDGLGADDPVTQYRDLIDQLGQPHPAFELGLRWLEANRPPPVEPVVVHGDFRNGNLVVGVDGLRAVLDWELAHVGEPAEDLAWLCLRAWRFGSELPVGGFGHRDELLDAYGAAGGCAIDDQRLHWWEIMGTLRWGVICIVQTVTHRAGLARSVELAAIGRRVCETERDLLDLLE